MVGLRNQSPIYLTTFISIWRDKNVTLRSKLRLMQAKVISVSLDARETWMVTAELEKEISGHVMLPKDPWHHLQRSCDQHTGSYEELKRRKLQWYRNVTRSPGLAKAILHGMVEGTRRRNGWITSKNGPGLTSPRHKSRRRTVRNAESCPDVHLLAYLDNPKDYGAHNSKISILKRQHFIG